MTDLNSIQDQQLRRQIQSLADIACYKCQKNSFSSLVILLCAALANIACVGHSAASHKSTHVLSKSGPYVRIDAGYSMPTSWRSVYYKGKPGGAPIVSIGSGYEVNKLFQFEGALSHRGKYTWKKAYDSGHGVAAHRQKIESYSLLLNAYWRLGYLLKEQFQKFDPYFVGGLGGSLNKGGAITSVNMAHSYYRPSADKTSFAWQLGIGNSYAISDKCSVDLSYKYVSLGKFRPNSVIVELVENRMTTVENESVGNGKLQAHEFTFGIVHKF